MVRAVEREQVRIAAGREVVGLLPPGVAAEPRGLPEILGADGHERGRAQPCEILRAQHRREHTGTTEDDHRADARVGPRQFLPAGRVEVGGATEGLRDQAAERMAGGRDARGVRAFGEARDPGEHLGQARENQAHVVEPPAEVAWIAGAAFHAERHRVAVRRRNDHVAARGPGIRDRVVVVPGGEGAVGEQHDRKVATPGRVGEPQRERAALCGIDEPACGLEGGGCRASAGASGEQTAQRQERRHDHPPSGVHAVPSRDRARRAAASPASAPSVIAMAIPTAGR